MRKKQVNQKKSLYRKFGTVLELNEQTQRSAKQLVKLAVPG